MAWWNSTPELRAAYARTRENVQPVRESMLACDAWVQVAARVRAAVRRRRARGVRLRRVALLVSRVRLGDVPELGFAALDLKSFAFGRIPRSRYRSLGKGSYPADWIDPGMPHTHVALDDAIEQGAILINAIRERDELPKIEGYMLLESEGGGAAAVTASATRSASRTTPPSDG